MSCLRCLGIAVRLGFRITPGGFARCVAAFTSLLALNQVSCRSRPAATTAALDAAAMEVLPKHDIPLDDFGYELNQEAFRQISQRIGCESAGQILALPANGSLKKTINKLIESRQFYSDMRADLSNQAALRKACASRDEGSIGQGVRQLVAAAGDKGVTLVLIGGTGSTLSERGLLAESQKIWAEADLGGKFAAARADCLKVYATIDSCAPEMRKRLQQIADGAGDKRLFFWTHGKGALVLLQALAQDPALRDKTLGIVTVAAPFGGATSATVAHDAIKAAAKASPELTEGARQIFDRDSLQALMTPSAALSAPNLAARIAQVEWQEATRAGQELHPAMRYQHLKTHLAQQDFRRSDGQSIPILHVASALDLAYLRPLPPLTVKNARLTVATDHAEFGHFIILLGASAFADYPLGDGVVALEHAVLPLGLVPTGLKPTLLALFTVDHGALILSGPKPGQGFSPDVAIVDGLLAAAATALKESAP